MKPDACVGATTEEFPTEEFHIPELLRLDAMAILAGAGDSPRQRRAAASAVAETLKKASSIARDQGLVLWELRIAQTIGRTGWLPGDGVGSDAHVESLLSRYPELRDLGELQSAAGLIELAASPPNVSHGR